MSCETEMMMRVFRELKWVSQTPPLLRYFARTREEEVKPGEVDVEISLVLSEFAEEGDWDKRIRAALPREFPDRRPIGRYFEFLLGVLVESHPKLTMRAANRKIVQNRQSIGELDAIVQNAGHRSHVECAVKFYLGVGDRRLEKNWHGPGKRDRMDKKWRRLFEHQLQLSGRPEIHSLLAEEGLDVHSRQAFVKGVLFHPWNAWLEGQLDKPEIIAEGHANGPWLELRELARLKNTLASWRPLSKEHWIGGGEGAWLSASELVSWGAAQPELPQMIECHGLGNTTGERGQESQVCMMVPDGWEDELV